MSISTSTNHQRALEYLLTKGYSVIPVGADKKPLINWKEYSDRLPTEEEISSWWGQWPNAGVGIVTGSVSGISVVDIDVKKEPITPLDTFPETYTVQTKSGGYHLYYDYWEGVQTGADRYPQYPHVDIRNDGGYVVAPPSEGYTILKNVEPISFPRAQFPAARKKRTKIGDAIKLSSGNRNQNLTSVIGTLLRATAEAEWGTEVWSAVVAMNETNSPPLSESELRTTFQSVCRLEQDRRGEEQKSVEVATKSPIEIPKDKVASLRMRVNGNGTPYKDKLNAMIALATSEEWRDAFKYDEFKKEIQYKGERLRDHHVLQAQTWLQGDMKLHGIPKAIVGDAVEERARVCTYNSATDYLKSLEWDGEPRIDHWLHRVYGVDDDEYHQKVGANWLKAIVKRIVWPGSKYDHVLVIVGGQGVKKTTSFAVLGGDWHIETTVQADSKDFLMQFDGKAIVEFSEGDTLNRSETKTLKAIITRTKDKYRAPYARHEEEHQRMCVFCMTTNETSFLKDETGNRRWLVVKMPEDHVADVEWLALSRDQLFAEAYARREEVTWDHPQDKAEEYQEDAAIHTSTDELVLEWYQGVDSFRREDGVTVKDAYNFLMADRENPDPMVPRDKEWQIKSAFGRVLKLEYRRKMLDGERKRAYFPTKKTPKYVSGGSQVGNF